MTNSYGQHSDYRHCHRGGAVYLAVEGFFWLLSAAFGAFDQIPVAILLLAIGGMFIHPVSLVVSRMVGLPQVNEMNRLPILNTWLALMIPLGLPLVYLVVSGGRTTLFYPAFSIIIGAHWLPFIYVYAMKSFAVLASLLVLIGIFFGFLYTDSFSACGFVSGGILLVFAITNALFVKKELQANK